MHIIIIIIIIIIIMCKRNMITILLFDLGVWKYYYYKNSHWTRIKRKTIYKTNKKLFKTQYKLLYLQKKKKKK